MIEQKITPCLWFDGRAEEAVRFYLTVFGNSKIKSIAKYDQASAEASGRELGSVLTVDFQIEGQDFVALNGGPQFQLSEAVSFVINCETQAEVDAYWSKLTAGGAEGPCGWLKDKFGLSWQVVPTILNELLAQPDTARAERVMKAMLQMNKLDISVLQNA
jgi:predicted 3-demethylubiquinone-9 3-methyltransferase (glyoxalase superfamily)